jgi:ABC-type amino acid transport substrate-binding protein
LVSSEASSIDALADVHGSTVCVSAGSIGESWLHGRASTIVGLEGVATPPERTRTTSLEDDDACMAELLAGRVDVVVTENLTDVDVLTRAGLRLVSSVPVFWEGRSAVVEHTGSASDPLAAATETALEAMRADGTLARLAGNRFGGVDLTTAPHE